MIGLEIRNHTVHTVYRYRAIFRNIPLDGIISLETVSLQGHWREILVCVFNHTVG